MTSVVFWVSVLTFAGIIASLAMVLNFEAGWGGMWDLGIAGLMAVGGYTYIIVTNDDPELGVRFAPGWPIWLGMLASSVVTGAVAFLIGWRTLRLRREYFLVVTFALAEVLRQLVIVQDGLTRGTRGFAQFDRPFSGIVSARAYNYLLLGLVAFACLVIYLVGNRLAAAPYGRALRAARDNEPLALSLGKQVSRLRLQTFVFVGVLIGLITPLYLWYLRFIGPELFVSGLTFTVWTALIIGGIGSRIGGILGALVLVSATEGIRVLDVSIEYQEYLNAFPSFIVGLTLVVVLRWRPEGLISERHSLASKGPGPVAAESLGGRGVGAETELRPVVAGATLSASNISKKFGGLAALNDVSLHVAPGTVVALIGPNGAGKTTLFNVLSGFDRADSGSIDLDGHQLAGLAPWSVARKGLARTFQTPIGFSTMTVWENLLTAGSDQKIENPIAALLARRRWTADMEQARDHALRVMNELSIAHLANHYMPELAPGEQKLVELARQAIRAPRLMLLDEPAAGVSADQLPVLSRSIRQLADNGSSILVIDHNMGFVFQLADHVYVMHLGEVVVSGTPEEVSQNAAVIEMYIGSSVEGADR